MLSQEEQTLLQKCLQGDHRAQAQLYRQYVQAMYNLVIRMCPIKSDAEDILQDVFVKVFQKLNTFKGDATLGAWIKRITINTTLMHLRKGGQINVIDLERVPEIADRRDVKEDFDMKRVHHAIKQLPAGCRVIFSLYLLEGYPHHEIAEILNISLSTSKTQYRRAKTLLRELLK